MCQRKPNLAEKLALAADIENGVGKKLDDVAPVKEEGVFSFRCAVVVERERLGVEDAALAENLSADIAADLVGIVVKVDV